MKVLSITKDFKKRKTSQDVPGVVVKVWFFKADRIVNKTYYDIHNKESLPKNNETNFICEILILIPFKKKSNF